MVVKKDEIYKRFVTVCESHDKHNGDYVFVKSIKDELKRDLELDSLDVVEIALACEDEFGIKMSDTDICRCVIVEDMIKVIIKELEKNER